MSRIDKLGHKDNTLKAVGREAGLKVLVEAFYAIMDKEQYAQKIRKMHPADLSLAEDKLITFLTGWMGGPQRYGQKFGSISIPGSHARFPIVNCHRDAWLRCMSDALIQLDYPLDVREYLLEQLAIPASRIVEASAAYRASQSKL